MDYEEMNGEPPDAKVVKDARTWAMVAHLAGLAMFTSIPAGNIVAPLIIWLVKKDEDPFIDEQGKEAVNFQITVFIALIIAFVSAFILIGFLLVPAIVIADIVLIIQAALKAKEGEPYRYPWTIRFIK